MPFENEHGCVLTPADKYDKFRRGTREHQGKKYSVIYGKIKDDTTWEDHSFRYSKETWTAAEARSHCKEHDGSFEAAAGKECEPCRSEIERIERIIEKITGETTKEPQGIPPDIIDRLEALVEKRKQIRELISKILKEEKRDE